MALAEHDLTKWANELASALLQYGHLFVHTQDLLLCDIWGALPAGLREFLYAKSFVELARFGAEPECVHPPPSSLAGLIRLRRLALSRTPPSRGTDEGATRGCAAGARRPAKKPERRAKKQHEIERLASVVHELAGSMGCTRILEAGSGMGGLAAELASRGLDVIGVEAQEKLAAAAATAAAAAAAVAPPGAGSVRTWNRAIVADDQAAATLESVCEEAWPPLGEGEGEGEGEGRARPPAGGGGILVCALHACGDLSPTLLRAFVGAPSLCGLALVPCCYNLLTVECEAEHSVLRCKQASKCAPCEENRDEDCGEDFDEEGGRALGVARSASVPDVAKATASVHGFPLSAVVRASGLQLTRDVHAASQREAHPSPKPDLNASPSPNPGTHGRQPEGGGGSTSRVACGRLRR